MNERERARVSLVSLGVGLAAAGVGAAIGLAAERVAIGRVLPGRPATGGPRDGEGDGYGEVRGRTVTVTTDDGVDLHVEVHEVDPGAGAGEAADGSQPTVIFCHGYALTQDSWHYQRKALRGRHRLVLWDQRGHGRSGSAPPRSATIDRIGADLAAVIEAVAPTGPLVLIGHSMGGMTIMALAEQEPELFGDRVVGVALVSTSAGGLGQIDFGLPRLGRWVHRVAPGTARALAQTARVAEPGRRMISDLELVLVRRYSYASDVSADLVRFTATMIGSTRLQVISDFLPTLNEHDRREALAALQGVELLVIVGDRDLLTPAQHSDEIVCRVPGAEHVVVRRGGHLLMLEHPEVVTGHLVELIDRALQVPHRGGGPLGRTAQVLRTVTPLGRRRRKRAGAA